tara:strand:+ start:1448 stop:2272 length:825 start_codon:yes stop_codon:yes gene_type:complete
MEDTKTKSLLIKEKIGLCQKSLGPNVYKNLFKEGVDPNITAYIDSEILRSFNDKAKIKVAILVEPRTVIPKIYDWMSANHNLFNMVMTHDKDLASLANNIRYYPIWPIVKIKQEDRKIYTKTKGVSAIFSERRMTEGHRLRHKIAQLFGPKIDLYGRGYNPIENKVLGTSDYRYQVVVENIKNGYVSEKANDCFVCGTVPIYWGSKRSNILDFYDERGIIFFDNLLELKNIFMNIISSDDYENREEFIKLNYQKAKNLTLDGVYYEYGLKELLI